MANEDTFHLGVKAVIKNNQGKILVLHANMKILDKDVADHWDLPGGRLQKGQNLEETLGREVEEEIGIKDLIVHQLIDASISKMRIRPEYGLVLFSFLCSIKDNQQIELTDDEHSEFGWFDTKDAAKLLSTKFSDEFVEKLVRLN